MKKLEVIKFLIQEIEEEKELFKIYEDDLIQATMKAEKNGKWEYIYRKYHGRMPARSRIKNNCKKIRQILSDISKEEN